MRWSLVVLAVPTVALGALAGLLPGWLGEQASLTPRPITSALSMALMAGGVLGTYLTWRVAPAADPAWLLGVGRRPLEQAFLVDEGYAAAVVRPVRAAARCVQLADRRVVDAYVRGSGRGARWTGGLLRHTQAGNAQAYLTGLIAGVVVLVIGAVILG
jgi:NADH-quinone oxidoreductase subunit L